MILVIHPRKEDEGVALSLASVSGTSKATQEADLVMILQKVNISRYDLPLIKVFYEPLRIGQ